MEDLYQDDEYRPGPPSAPRTDLYGGIGESYKKHLGRTARQDELEFHARTSPTNYDNVIKGSSEAQAWNSRNTAAPAAAPVTGNFKYGNSIEGQLRSQWEATTSHTPADLARLVASNPAYAGVQVRGDSLVFPDGRIIDAVMDENGRNAPGWIDINAQKAAGGAIGGGAGVGAGAGAWGSGTLGNSQRDELFKTLMGRSKQSLSINAQTDPNIRQQVDPYEAAQIRASREHLADAAEKSGPYANLQGEARMAAERRGQATGLFESTLVNKELTNRRDEIQNALAQMGGMLGQDQQVALQRELTMINDRLQRAQMSQQNDQFGANLGLQAEDKRSYWDAIRSGVIS